MAKWSPPKSKHRRAKVAARCGLKKCFLRPSTLNYPVCTSGCAVSCQGLRAAYLRAQLNRDEVIKGIALHRAKRAGCEWAKGKAR